MFIAMFTFRSITTIFVESQSSCVGTCYSGQMFPVTQDIFHGKHLKGHSYKNITTDDQGKCYRHCVQDCRCKACQMKDATCELLDEDKTSKAGDFVNGPGYVYFDLRQTMYQGQQSHMVAPGECYNGCCRSQPCLNGGTCVEHCNSPKDKFTCECIKPLYHGKVCEVTGYPRSCLDILKSSPKGILPQDGNYTIQQKDKETLWRIYCWFEAPNKAWTLMESYSMSNNRLFKTKSYHQPLNNGERFNHNEPNWTKYRLRTYRMKYFRDYSTMFRFTCNFPKRKEGSLTQDFLFGYLSDYDIINNGDNNKKCFNFAHINIRGKDLFNVTALPRQLRQSTHFHIVCGGGLGKDCPIQIPDQVLGEDCFGYYDVTNPNTTCSQSSDSTTQFWLGAEM